MKLGIDVLFSKKRDLLSGKKIGVLAHKASIDSNGVHILEHLTEGESNRDWELSAIFAPEHGLESAAQDMESVSHKTIQKSKNKRGVRGDIPVYSLYGNSFASLSPTPEMIKGLDILVVDLQDIGTRYYTYANTMALCMRVCGSRGVDVLVLDRPNPINGVDVEGTIVEQELRSFVGMYPIPVRHGKTIGELAQFMLNQDFPNPSRDFLKIVPMEGWKKESFWDETGLKWVNPSPNMRSLAAALLYPGMCLLEGTNISEGRGTHTPFEVCGAPWIDGKILSGKLKGLKLKGIAFEEAIFTPTTRKFEGERCEGVKFAITDRSKVKPYLTGLALIYTIATTYKKYFQWRREPYEFVSDIPAIDLLVGNRMFRKFVDKGKSLDETLKVTLSS